MILFYNKKTGKIFGSVNGRVHDNGQMKMEISDGSPKEDIGKFIIGWIEKDGKMVESNMEKFEIMQRFEADIPENPLDYKIDVETNNLIKK